MLIKASPTLRKILFASQQTSGTGSMWRIFKVIGTPKYTFATPIDQGLHAGKSFDEAIANAISIIADGPSASCSMFNAVQSLPERSAFGQIYSIINFRDPRDYFCNLYHWQFVHPHIGDTDGSKLKAHAEKIRSLGIDSYVKNLHLSWYFNKILDFAESIPKEERSVLSYARLCLDYDDFIRRACSAFQCELDDALKTAVEPERTSNITKNPAWIGNKWQGADTSPCRYKGDLEPSTISILNDEYSSVLKRMASLDPDFETYYLDGIS